MEDFKFEVLNRPQIMPKSRIEDGMKFKVLSRYISPRKVKLPNGVEVGFYPLPETVEDARPVWDF